MNFDGSLKNRSLISNIRDLERTAPTGKLARKISKAPRCNTKAGSKVFIEKSADRNDYRSQTPVARNRARKNFLPIVKKRGQGEKKMARMTEESVFICMSAIDALKEENEISEQEYSVLFGRYCDYYQEDNSPPGERANVDLLITGIFSSFERKVQEGRWPGFETAVEAQKERAKKWLAEERRKVFNDTSADVSATSLTPIIRAVGKDGGYALLSPLKNFSGEIC